LLRNVEANKIAKVPKGVRVSSECKCLDFCGMTYLWKLICWFLLLGCWLLSCFII
jgi:hypothetical protein